MTAGHPPRARADLGLLAVAVLGLAALLPLARVLDLHRPALDRIGEGAPFVVAPETARRASLGFNGLLADWYWLGALQYIGRKLESAADGPLSLAQSVELDRLKAVDPRVLVQYFEMITTLDPRFTGVYEFAAVVLPAVDPDAAVTIVEKGIREDPNEWYLHQQLAYIHWQRGNHLAAAEAFRRGARLTTATWMSTMADRLVEGGDDPSVGRAIYQRMYEQARDEHVRQWAQRRLLQMQSLTERETIRRVLTDHVAAHGRCPRAWAPVAAAVHAAGLAVDATGAPLDPGGTPYLLVIGDQACDVTLHPRSSVPRG
jgi:hypothetical protein